MRDTPPIRFTWLPAALSALLFAYLMFARTRASADSLHMLGDQIRDWRLALGPLSALPLTGTTSTAGGFSLGPIYYWVLWLSRVVVGPWTSNLPHAGAIGISILQTTADLALLHALYKKSGSLWLALAATLLTATASHDLAISATIWNPSVSVAFVKLAIALTLLAGPQPTFTWMIATTIAAWFAVQAHSSALFAAAPILGSFVLRDVARRQLRAAFARARTIVEVILVLQVPLLYHLLTAPPLRSGNPMGEALARTLSHPESLRIGDSFFSLINSTTRIFVVPYWSWWWTVVLGAALVLAAIRARRDLAMLSVTVLPLLAAVLGFAIWQLAYDEYWYLPLAPCAAVGVVWGLTAIRQHHAALAVLIIVIALQPARLAHSLQWYRMPEYRALTHGAREIVHQTREIRRIETSFPLPHTSSATFLYEVLGGRLTDGAGFDATIDANGHATFTPVR